MNPSDPAHRYPDDEIDLGQLLLAIWEGKWLVGGITAACVAIAILYLVLVPTTFKGELDIRPITSFDAEPYELLNELDFFHISRSNLITMFGERLATREDFITAIQNRDFIDSELFLTDNLYADDVRREINKIEIYGPGASVLRDNQGQPLENDYLRITFESRNEASVTGILADTFVLANEFVRNTLEKRFNSRLNVTRQMQEFDLEDITRRIENAKADYERDTSDRLEYLKEQALIARQLGVATSTIESQTFSGQGAVVANVVTDTPFYYRGYEAIEKQIELLRGRSNVEAFIPDLATLERRQRAIEEDPYLDRVAAAFAGTPIVSPEEFRAARWDTSTIQIEPKTRPALVLALSIVLGGMLGLFVLFVRIAVTNTRNKAA